MLFPPSEFSPAQLSPAQPVTDLPTVDVTLPCQVGDTLDLWFAEGGDDVERAKAMCAACPLRAACLEGALTRREPWGVWGGEVFIDGTVVARKRGRGRPRKVAA
ncbi:WhiB family transcriptional regulator [Serinibacter arcticus]|uniref:WhiB family transcriptional regulator n=2 Tax=Serinibacter arcticus TaxID=1655435 RepID=A0A2U1ZZL8_9MICO|nr:WhiB family transcriptional regulator [Serinibacter arcticus]